MSLREEVIKTPNYNAVNAYMSNNIELLNECQLDFETQMKAKEFSEDDELKSKIESIPDQYIRHTFEKI